MRHGNPWRETAEKLHDTAPMIAALLVAAGLYAAGCVSRRAEPEPRVIVLSEHCQTAAPGDTVPPLPEGEPRWWLCTPTGLRMMMPDDCDFPDVEDKEGD